MRLFWALLGTNTMSVHRLLLVLLGLSFSVPAANAAPVIVGDAVALTRGSGFAGAYEQLMSINGGATSFVSFSLQLGKDVSFTNALVVGGVNTSAMTDASGADPISSQTAWLYTQFRANALAGYDGSGRAANRLQEAIWFFENEAGFASQASNRFVLLANQAIQSGWAGTGTVGVANLFLQDGRVAQDQLILLPSPAVASPASPASPAILQVPGPATLMLIGPGLLGLGLMRRRRTVARD
jgi:hypothetical protein